MTRKVPVKTCITFKRKRSRSLATPTRGESRIDALLQHITANDASSRLVHDSLTDEYLPTASGSDNTTAPARVADEAVDDEAVGDDIYFRQREPLRDDSITFDLYSYTHQPSHIMRFLSNVLVAQERSLANKLGDDLYYFDQVAAPSQLRKPNMFLDPSAVSLTFTKAPFVTHRTFDNVFFPQRDEVARRLQFFLTRPDWYEKHGVARCFALLMYGPPGTGKTSLVKTIAKLAHRHVVNVNMSNVNTNAQMKRLFYDETVQVLADANRTDPPDTLRIPINERMYVIEDIDAMQSSVVMRRDALETQTTADASPPHIVDGLHMSTLLNILDGTLETPGRIIVITTNRLRDLDPALIRPGRIDMILHFDRYNRDTIAQHVAAFYETDEFTPAGVFDAYPTMDGRWTGADIMQILFRNMDRPKMAISELIQLASVVEP